MIRHIQTQVSPIQNPGRRRGGKGTLPSPLSSLLSSLLSPLSGHLNNQFLTLEGGECLQSCLLQRMIHLRAFPSIAKHSVRVWGVVGPQMSATMAFVRRTKSSIGTTHFQSGCPAPRYMRRGCSKGEVLGEGKVLKISKKERWCSQRGLH